MATGTLGSTARYHANYSPIIWRKNFVFADIGVLKTIGVAPSGMILDPVASHFVVTTAYNGTTPTLSIGTSANDDLYGTVAALGAALARIPGSTIFDEAATATGVNAWLLAADTTLVATIAMTGGSTGAGSLIIYGYPNLA